MASSGLALLSPYETLVLLGLAVFALLLYLRSSRRPSRNLPPGPPPLPLIGNLHLINIKRQDKSFMKLSEKYGPVFTVHLGFQKAVVLTGYKAVKEALLSNADEFVDRPPVPIFYRIQHGNGVFFSSGELWRTTRRFTMSSLRDLGMGKKPLEGRILEELRYLLELVKSFKGEPFKLRSFNTAPTNITFTMLFGDRFDYADPTFVTLLRLIDEVMILLGSPYLHLFNFYPFLGFFLKPHKLILEKVEEVCVILRKHIEASKETINANNLRSYTDALLFRQQEEMNKATSVFDDANILASVLDLVMAGTETTATTLQWAVLLLMKHPEIQRKVQEEIKTVLGSGRLPTFDDKKRLPYSNAVIHEVLRFITLLPHIPRRTAVDTHFGGYFIPKGTMVIPLLTSVLLDKTQWETPDQFNPNHFLDADGNFVKREAFLPFSTGRRNCLGESLAKMELFLFFVGLFQRFSFRPPPGFTESDLDTVAVPGFTMRPRAQTTCAVPYE
ncbi:cytochrome P450 2W1 [Heteronotia binoei]|uniref:cytochrome P450 2W1 n=1 Tax=Heteronotia binoei TaxID=13085 RepID=UPI002931EB32|nr:cytochrome P450 2W1 [Heteronotia binoei]